LRIAHLIFYSFYKTASQINRIIPLKDGGIGGVGIFLSLLAVTPLGFIFKLSRKSHLNLENSIKYLITLVILWVVISYFDNNGNKIIKQLENENRPAWQRILLSNGFLIIYIAAFIYFLR
jgi:hypothetical protein